MIYVNESINRLLYLDLKCHGPGKRLIVISSRGCHFALDRIGSLLKLLLYGNNAVRSDLEIFLELFLGYAYQLIRNLALGMAYVDNNGTAQLLILFSELFILHLGGLSGSGHGVCALDAVVDGKSGNVLVAALFDRQISLCSAIVNFFKRRTI